MIAGYKPSVDLLAIERIWARLITGATVSRFNCTGRQIDFLIPARGRREECSLGEAQRSPRAGEQEEQSEQGAIEYYGAAGDLFCGDAGRNRSNFADLYPLRLHGWAGR